MAGFDDKPLLRCVECGYKLDFDPWTFRCPRCGGLLEVVVPQPRVLRSDAIGLGVWRYREALPVPGGAKPVTLGEGGTPLVEAEVSGRGARVYVKFEGSNPTGSFKDRGMSVAVTIARAAGARVTVAASTGNTAASMAAYSSRAGLRPVVVLPSGGVALGKLLQAALHGALVAEVEGGFDRALSIVMEAVGPGGAYPLNSFNPVRLEGQKTIAYEIVEQLGYVPDTVIVPVGNAGNISAIWKGFQELARWGETSELPRMVGVQAAGASPLVNTWLKGLDSLEPVENPKTIASAIRIGRPVNWVKALRAIRESNGLLVAVDDEEILRAMRVLATRVGLGVEPSSAAPLAALWRLEDEGIIDPGETVVLVATGHALKDPAAMEHAARPSIIRIDDSEALRALLAGGSREG